MQANTQARDGEATPCGGDWNTPRVRAVIDFLYERLSRHIRKLEMKRATEAAAAA